MRPEATTIDCTRPLRRVAASALDDRTGAGRRPRTGRASALLAALLVLAVTVAAAVDVGDARAATATFTVNSTADGTAKDGALTLREAILLANGGTGPNGLGRPLSLAEKLQTAGCAFIGSGDSWSIFGDCGAGIQDRIEFDLVGCPCTIAPASGLPPTTERVVLDGYSQPGSALNTDPNGSNAKLLVTIDGSNAGPGTSGLIVAGGSSFVQGLIIADFGGDGLVLTAQGNDFVSGNVITQAGQAGIFVDSPGNSIGGGSAASRNVINRCGADGIEVGYAMVSNGITGNLIGTGSNGKDRAGNGGDGISTSASATMVWGNVIAFNDGVGVDVLDGVYVWVTENRIYGNGGLAIDLGGDGVTSDDRAARDADVGPNRLQNFPVLTRADHVTGRIRGKLISTPNTTFTVEVFASGSCDPSGHGEARTALGAVTVVTNAKGVARFTLHASAAFSAGDVVSATASDPNHSTSELSRCATAT